MFHILVADDDKNTRLFLRAVLEGAGYTVTAVSDGEAALEAMECEHIDLAVLVCGAGNANDRSFHVYLPANYRAPGIIIPIKLSSSCRTSGSIKMMNAANKTAMPATISTDTRPEPRFS